MIIRTDVPMIRASSNSVTLLGDEHLEVRNRLAVRSVVAADGLAVAVAGSAGGLEVVEAEEQLGVLGAGGTMWWTVARIVQPGAPTWQVWPSR